MKKREAPTNNIHFNSHEEEEAKEDLIPGIEGFIVDNVDETECSDSESNYSPISPFLSLPPSQDFKSRFVQDEPDFSPGNESEFEETPTLCLTPEPSPNFNFVKTQGLMMRALTPDSSSDCSPSYSIRKRDKIIIFLVSQFRSYLWNQVRLETVREIFVWHIKLKFI